MYQQEDFMDQVPTSGYSGAAMDGGYAQQDQYMQYQTSYPAAAAPQSGYQGEYPSAGNQAGYGLTSQGTEDLRYYQQQQQYDMEYAQREQDLARQYAYGGDPQYQAQSDPYAADRHTEMEQLALDHNEAEEHARVQEEPSTQPVYHSYFQEEQEPDDHESRRIARERRRRRNQPSLAEQRVDEIRQSYNQARREAGIPHEEEEEGGDRRRRRRREDRHHGSNRGSDRRGGRRRHKKKRGEDGFIDYAYQRDHTEEGITRSLMHSQPRDSPVPSKGLVPVMVGQENTLPSPEQIKQERDNQLRGVQQCIVSDSYLRQQKERPGSNLRQEVTRYARNIELQNQIDASEMHAPPDAAMGIDYLRNSHPQVSIENELERRNEEEAYMAEMQYIQQNEDTGVYY